MRRNLRGFVFASAIAAALVATPSEAAPRARGAKPEAPKAEPPRNDSPKAAGETSQVKPAAERTLEAPVAAKPKGQGSTRTGSSGKPVFRGTKVPDALRETMRARMDARIDQNLVQVRALRGEAIGLLSKFVAESPREAREMPEAMMRLGELKWELEREQFVERFRAWEAKPVDQRGPAPSPNYAPSRELFGRVLRDYPWFEQYDLALYVDGFMATEQGKPEEALARFERILRDHPRSRFRPDAHMARAEFLFNEKYDYRGALAEYEAVLATEKTDLRGLALFKSAWCLWRLGQNDEAAKRFVSVFEVTDDKKQKVSAQQKRALDELQGEALKYLVEVFTEDERNSAGDVHVFLQKIGGDRFAGKIVRALAETYFDQANYRRGIEAYELLLKLEPTSPEAGRWVLRIAEGYSTVEDYPQLKATYDRAIKGYTAGSAWAKAQGDPAVVAETTAAIESQLREHAVQLHARAQKDKSRAEFEGAASLYEVYLARFANEKGAYRVQFYLGEIEFHRLGRNMQAATHYMAAARTIPAAEAKPGSELGTMRHDALYNAIAALERVRVQELEARKGKPGEAESETDKKFAEALDLYAQLYPDDPALPELFFRQGKLYYDYGIYDAAVRIWGSLLEKFPKSSYAEGAGELILDSFNRAKDYENIETWARRLKGAAAFQGAEQQRRLDALIVQAVFKQGEQKAESGEHQAAAQAYLRAAREFPKDARAAQALVNAALEAQKAGDLATLKAAGQLATSKDYRDKVESPRAAWAAATTLQSMGLFGDAADFHEGIAQLNDRDHPHYQRYEHTKDAAFNAVVLRAALGQNDKAVQNGTKYLAAYGTSPDADEVVFLMGKAHQSAGRNKEAADLYRRYLARSKNQDHRVQGYVLLAKAQVRIGDERGADEALKDAVEIGKRRKGELGPDGRYAAAEARYMEGERVLARFDKIQIQGDVKQLSGRLKQKAELLKQASTIFLDTVSMGVAEWSTAALFQIGRTYESFAAALRDAPPPANLSDAEKEAYQAQIDEFVVPIEERSLDAYENGWKKAVDLGIYNQWTAKMREALGRMNGELYPPLKEQGFDVRSHGPNPLPPLLDGPRRGAPQPPKGKS
jgi:tetratricopeptide (TPR) repeat protein